MVRTFYAFHQGFNPLRIVFAKRAIHLSLSSFLFSEWPTRPPGFRTDMNILTRFKPITTFVLDVDGVLTDGSILVFETGEQVRLMNTKDGYAIGLAMRQGYKMAVISGGGGTGVQQRLSKLGVTDIFMGVADKRKKLEEYLKTHALDREQILYMGDDIPDYSMLDIVGLFCAPADAVADIQRVAHYISPVAGGRGCVRDVIEKVLRLNDHWNLESQTPSI